MHSHYYTAVYKLIKRLSACKFVSRSELYCLWLQSTNVADRQTDGRTDRRHTRACFAW